MNRVASHSTSNPGTPFWGAWSIRTRLMLLVLLSVLPALGIIFHAGLEEKKKDIENAKQNVLLTVENLAKRQEIITSGIRQMLMVVADYPSVLNGDVETTNKFISRLQEHSPSNCEFIAVRLDGTAFAVGKEAAPFNLADRNYFREVLVTRDFVVGEHVFSRSASIPVLPFAYPVINEQDQLAGMIVAAFNLEQYQHLLQQMGLPEGSIVGIEDRNGSRLFRFPQLNGRANEGVGQQLPEKIRRYIAGQLAKGTYTEKGVDGVRRIYGFSQLRLIENDKPYLYIRVGIPEKTALLPAKRNLRSNLILFSIACSLALAAAWFLGNLTLVDPIKQLVEVSLQLGGGNLQVRSQLSHTRRGEIGLLAQALDMMAYNQELRENERILSHQAISELSRQNRLILNAAGEGIVGLNAEGMVIFINPAAASMTGYEVDELMEQDLHLKIHHLLPDGSPYNRNSCPMYKTLRWGTACRVRDEVLWRKDGTNFPCAYSSTPIVNDGRISGAVIIFRDISERKRAETVLRNSEAHFRLLIENIYDVITVLDGCGNIRYVSPSLERVLGYTFAELANRNSCELVHRDDLILVGDEFGRSLVTIGACFSLQMRCLHRNGSWRIMETIGKSFLDREGQTAVVVNSHDITERKQAEEEKVAMEAQFFQAQKMESVGRLAGGVAHDYNNMLSVIIGHAGLVLRQLAHDDPFRESLVEIKNAASRSADLTRQLLAFARKQTIIPKILDLNETIANILKMLQRLIGEQIDIAWIPDDKLWPVRMDPTQIDQILVNLAVNARDAITDSGTITIATNNLIIDKRNCQDFTLFPPGDFVVMTVTDTGEGMDEETLGHIFEPFFTTKELGKGTGLGLATVYGAVKQNNGLIEVDSEPGQGTSFRIYLPRTCSPIKEQPVSILARNLWGTETVLVVEDEKSIITVTRSILEQYGYTVLGAASPHAALTMAGNFPGPIDLLITDIRMPKMSGMELDQALQLIKPGHKCLFWSDDMIVADSFAGVLEEGIHILQKPFAPETLIEKIRDVLASPKIS